MEQGLQEWEGCGAGITPQPFIVESVARLANKRELEMAHRSDVFQRGASAVECGLCFVKAHACRMWVACCCHFGVCKVMKTERGSNWAQVIVINTIVISVLSHTISIDTGNQFVTLLCLLCCSLVGNSVGCRRKGKYI